MMLFILIRLLKLEQLNKISLYVKTTILVDFRISAYL
jgi:hypothetical protein